MQSLPKILVINSSSDQTALKRVLKVNYDVHESLEENDYVSETHAFAPDLIIIDVFDDPKKITVLEHLRNTPGLVETPFLLSAPKSDIEEIKKTYDYNDDDFLIAPAERKDLISKVRSKIKRKQALSQLVTKINEKEDNAYVALYEAHELGVIIQFYRSCFSCSNPHDVISRIFQVSNELELKMSVYIHHNKENIFSSSRNSKDTSYKQVMRDALNKGRYVDMGPATIVNYEYISLLVHNMPVESPKHYGQLKDHLSMLTAGANGCLEYMEADEILQEQHKKQTADMAEASCKMLIEIDDYFRQDMAHKRQLVEDSLLSLEKQIAGLSDTANPTLKAQIQTQIELTKETVLAGFDRDKNGDEPLNIVLDGLKTILIYCDDPY